MWQVYNDPLSRQRNFMKIRILEDSQKKILKQRRDQTKRQTVRSAQICWLKK